MKRSATAMRSSKFDVSKIDRLHQKPSYEEIAPYRRGVIGVRTNHFVEKLHVVLKIVQVGQTIEQFLGGDRTKVCRTDQGDLIGEFFHIEL